MKIFYIEDDQDLGEMVYELLTENGHDVIWIIDRANLPSDFKGFDLVISDYEVPGGEFEWTKTRCELDGVPLILASGGGWDTAEAPHHPLLDKPFSLEALIDMVNEVVK